MEVKVKKLEFEIKLVKSNGEDGESDADDEDQNKMVERLVKILKYHNAKQLIITMMVKL